MRFLQNRQFHCKIDETCLKPSLAYSKGFCEKNVDICKNVDLYKHLIYNQSKNKRLCLISIDIISQKKSQNKWYTRYQKSLSTKLFVKEMLCWNSIQYQLFLFTTEFFWYVFAVSRWSTVGLYRCYIWNILSCVERKLVPPASQSRKGSKLETTSKRK